MRTIFGASMILALGLSLAACGGGEEGRPSAQQTAASAPDGLKFARCMRENGIPMEDPKPGNTIALGVKPDDPKFTKAYTACKQFAPTPGGADAKMSAAEVAELAKYAKCMREHGVDMPDPKADGSMTAKALRADDMPKMEAADKACAQFRPGGN